MENIPNEGGALLIYYHGALPIDVYYMMGRIKTAKKRNLRNVVAEFLFHFPGMQLVLFLQPNDYHKLVIPCRIFKVSYLILHSNSFSL